MAINILAIDTATEACSVALSYKGEVTSRFEINPRGHTQRILPLIDELLQCSNITLAQLDAIAFGRGPGSFTGVRIVSSVAQGLAFGADLPVIPVSNLTAMAQEAYEKSGLQEVAVAIDARMSEVYFSQLKAKMCQLEGETFVDWQAIIDEQVLPPAKVNELLLAQQRNDTLYTAGTGWDSYSELSSHLSCLVSSKVELPNAAYMLLPAKLAWLRNQTITAEEIEPIYLRNNVAWKKLPGRE